MRLISIFATVFLVTASNTVLAQETTERSPQEQKILALLQGLHPQYGEVRIPSTDTTLHLGKEYYFLSANEAKSVLVDGWKNSSESVSDVLGMIFPNGKTFVDDSWAAVITYEGTGYVSDGDARSTDYGEILKSAQSGEDESNERRKSEQLAPVHLVGWAQPPSYDQSHHTLIWARDIRFGAQQNDTLNYDLRSLGRRGVLNMNIVSEMSKLNEIRSVATGLQNVATFDLGARYIDYNASTDKKAEYGLAGLVAAGVGAAVAQKLGIFAIALLFFKKAAIFVIAAVAGVLAWIKRFFGKRDQPPPMADR